MIRFASGTTGYENIKDKPDLSKFGTVTMINQINKDILDMQADIDGKIDTYYQTSNPWNSWPSGSEPGHVGDLWYNTATDELKIYVGPSSNTWREVTNKDAIDAARQVADAADVKADSKRRVFLTTPKPPYDTGDQWISGKGATPGRSTSACRAGSRVRTWLRTGSSRGRMPTRGRPSTGACCRRQAS